MEILLIKIIQTLLLPPGLMILLMLAGYFLARRMPRTGKIMLLSGFGLLVLASLPIVAQLNLQLLEGDTALSATELTEPQGQAIVILSGGRNPSAPEYDNVDTINKHALERVRYGAWLHRHTQLPILVTGGNVFDSSRPGLGELMQKVLTEEYQVPVQWIEKYSRNSWENAKYSQVILKEVGIKRIYLVTQAWHMPRARMAFEAVGLEIIPAPTGFLHGDGDAPLILDFLPSSRALLTNFYVAHELIGIVWYKLRYL
jgi:uncharacterized SAM-binding protein YcdF (DUF218 family)